MIWLQLWFLILIFSGEQRVKGFRYPDELSSRVARHEVIRYANVDDDRHQHKQ